MKWLLILAACPLFAGTQSLVNQSSNGNFTIPNSAPFTSSPTFFAEGRFSGLVLPGTCYASMFGSGTFQTSGFGIRLCDPVNRGSGAFQLWGQGPGLSGGPDLEIMPPNQSIIAVTASATAPEIFFSSKPFPIAFQVGASVLINAGTGGAGNLPGGCAGLAGLKTITTVNPTSIIVSANATGCVYVSGAIAMSNDFRYRIQWDDAGGQLRAEVWNVDGTGYAVATVAIPSGELTATYPQTLIQWRCGCQRGILPAVYRHYSGGVCAAPRRTHGFSVPFWHRDDKLGPHRPYRIGRFNSNTGHQRQLHHPKRPECHIRYNPGLQPRLRPRNGAERGNRKHPNPQW